MTSTPLPRARCSPRSRTATGVRPVGAPVVWAVAAFVPFALLDFVNLLETQWADRLADRAVGKNTMASRLSPRGIQLLGGATVLAAYSLSVASQPSPVAAAGLLAAPLSIYAVWRLGRGSPGPSVAAMIVFLLAQGAAWVAEQRPRSPLLDLSLHPRRTVPRRCAQHNISKQRCEVGAVQHPGANRGDAGWQGWARHPWRRGDESYRGSLLSVRCSGRGRVSVLGLLALAGTSAGDLPKAVKPVVTAAPAIAPSSGTWRSSAWRDRRPGTLERGSLVSTAALAV